MPKDSNVLAFLSVSRVLRQKGPLILPSKKLPGKQWVLKNPTMRRTAEDNNPKCAVLQRPSAVRLLEASACGAATEPAREGVGKVST